MHSAAAPGLSTRVALLSFSPLDGIPSPHHARCMGSSSPPALLAVRCDGVKYGCFVPAHGLGRDDDFLAHRDHCIYRNFKIKPASSASAQETDQQNELLLPASWSPSNTAVARKKKHGGASTRPRQVLPCVHAEAHTHCLQRCQS